MNEKSTSTESTKHKEGELLDNIDFVRGILWVLLNRSLAVGIVITNDEVRDCPAEGTIQAIRANEGTLRIRAILHPLPPEEPTQAMRDAASRQQ